MSIIAPGTTAPTSRCGARTASAFTNADLAGKTVVLVFYPFAFSPVCTDQFQVYQEALGEITEGRRRDLRRLHRRLRTRRPRSARSSASRSRMLSDFEPKGAASRALGAYFEPGGMTNRALVVFKDGVVAWSWLGEHPGVLPGVNLVFDGLAAAQGS